MSSAVQSSHSYKSEILFRTIGAFTKGSLVLWDVICNQDLSSVRYFCWFLQCSVLDGSPLVACLTPDRAIVTPTQTHNVTFGDLLIKPAVPNNLLLPPSLTFAQH